MTRHKIAFGYVLAYHSRIFPRSLTKIRLIESIAKCRYLNKLTCKGTLRQVFICLGPAPLLGFCLGRKSNIVGSECGQKQSVKLLQNMVSNTTQHPTPHPSQPLTFCTYIRDFDFGKGGEGWGRRIGEKVIGAIVHRKGSKIPKWLTESTVSKLY